MTIPKVTLADKQVGRMGFGLMQLTWTPKEKRPSQEASFAVMKAAADQGATAWSTASFYGAEDQLANIKLIAAFFEKYPEYKDKIVLVLKGGCDEKIHPVADIDFLRKDLKRCQAILKDKVIDIYSYARLPLDSSVEEVFTNLETLRKEGLFSHVGASEMKTESLVKAQKITPIAIIEIEVSLWSFDSDIQDVVAWSKQNKVPVFCYSPLGRGFITRTYKSPEDIPEGDFKKMVPRFQGEAFYENLKLVDLCDELAEKKGLKTAQMALAWLISLSDYTIPIPGSSNPGRAKENIEAANIKLTPEDTKGISDILANFEVKGGRYPDAGMGHLMQ